MKTKYFWLTKTIVLITILLSSCATEYNFNIDVLKPAEISIPENVKKIIVINHSYIPNSCSITDIDGNTNPGFDSTFSFQHISSFVDYMKYSPRYEVVKVFSIAKNKYNKLKPINLKTVDELCKKEGADAAVILDGCFTSKKLEEKTLNSSSNNGTIANDELLDTTKSKKSAKHNRNNGLINYDLVLGNTSVWEVYSAVKGKIVDVQDINDISNIFAKGYSVESAFRFSPSVWNVMFQSSARAGNEYAHRIAQQWVQESRTLYNLSGEGFEDAIAFSKNNNWDKAIEIWQNALKIKDPEIASKSAYNIAVAYEVKDNLNAALDWAAKSYLLQNNKASDKYIKLLETRIKDKKQIDNQLSLVDAKPEI